MEGLDWDVADLYCSCDGIGVSEAQGRRREQRKEEGEKKEEEKETELTSTMMATCS